MPKKPAEPPLENLAAALSDVPSDGHDDAGMQAPTEPPIVTARLVDAPPAKKPRTESPGRIATRAYERALQIDSRVAAEVKRHATRLAELNEERLKHAADCEKLPDPVRKILGKLIGESL